MINWKKKKKKLFKNNIFQFIVKFFLAVFVRVLSFSYRYEILGKYSNRNIIFTFWHRNLIPLIYNRRNENVGVLISSSSDGSVIANIIELFGFKSIRGSSAKYGVRALKEMISYGKNYSLAITPDGPKGPIYILKDGILTLGYLSKMPIVSVELIINKEWTFSSWDKFRIPKPFAKIKIIYKEPVFIKDKNKFDEYKDKLTTLMGK